MCILRHTYNTSLLVTYFMPFKNCLSQAVLGNLGPDLGWEAVCPTRWAGVAERRGFTVNTVLWGVSSERWVPSEETVGTKTQRRLQVPTSVYRENHKPRDNGLENCHHLSSDSFVSLCHGMNITYYKC